SCHCRRGRSPRVSRRSHSARGDWPSRPTGARDMISEKFLILMAEDDEGHANLIQRNLKRAGVKNEIFHVKDGQEALDFIHRRGPYAGQPLQGPLLVLLDINMPKIDGVEVLRTLKSDADTARIPVIVLTTTDD